MVRRTVVSSVGTPVPKMARQAERRGAAGGWAVSGLPCEVEATFGVTDVVDSGCRGGSVVCGHGASGFGGMTMPADMALAS